jgi:hypothetical protein
MNRDTLISNSILQAIFKDQKDEERSTFFGRLGASCAFYQLTLSRYRHELFKRLRNDVWKIDEKEYTESFKGQGSKDALKPVGDLGYSGSVR